MVLAAKSDPDAADALISQYMGFIRAEAKKLSFGDGEDELSVAMLAFYEATLGYERSRGSFLSFAARVIRSRLIDYNRAESRHRGHGSLNERASDDGAELLAMFRLQCGKNGYTLGPETEAEARRLFDELYETRDENFGNGRTVRNIFEDAVARQADRIAAMDAPSREQLMELLPEDFHEEDET